MVGKARRPSERRGWPSAGAEIKMGASFGGWHMRGVGRFLIGFFLLAIFVGIPLLFILSLQREPLVRENPVSVFSDVKQAQATLARFSPSGLSPDTVTDVSISEMELNSGISAALFTTNWAKARVEISGGELLLMGTAAPHIPKNPIGQYVNLRASIPSSSKGFKVSRLSVGNVPVPTFLVRPTLIFAMDRVIGPGKGRAFYESVRYVRISGDTLTVGLQPPKGFKEDLKDAARRTILVADADTIRAYYERLVDIEKRGNGRVQSLSVFMGSAFQLAKLRSQVKDPIVENKGLILAFALYFGDDRFEKLMGGVKTGALAGTGANLDLVKLENRTDWVQHFLTSAGLLVAGGETVSDVLGQAKEVSDSDGPEGFAFTDIGADHAGIRFAQVATASLASARRVQQMLAGTIGESAFFPKVGDLPEGLGSDEFKRRYGDVNSPAYKKVIDEIDRRIAAIPLYQ